MNNNDDLKKAKEMLDDVKKLEDKDVEVDIEKIRRAAQISDLQKPEDNTDDN